MSLDDAGTAAAQDEDDKPLLDRAEARVNLMRKLSARRLESPAASDGSSPSRSRDRDEAGVVGRRGKARPRSGSMGALDWRLGANEGERRQEVPEVPQLPFTAVASALPPLDTSSFAVGAGPSSAAPLDSARSGTSMSVRSSGVWRAERDRESWAAREKGGDRAWEFEDSPAEEGDEEEVIRTSQAGVPVVLGATLGGGSAWQAKEADDEAEAEDDGWEMITPRPTQDVASSAGRFDTPKESPRQLDGQGGDAEESPFTFDPRAAAARAAAAAKAANSHRALNAGNYLFANAPAPAPIVLRPDSIPEHVRPLAAGCSAQPPQPLVSGPGGSALATTSLGLTSPSSHRQPPAPSFGIRAVEEPDSDIRRRGSSASSSVAFLDARRGQGSASGVLAGRNGSVGSESMLGLGVGLRTESGSGTPSSERTEAFEGPSRANSGPIEEEEMETVEVQSGWPSGMREQRLAAKVERKREAGLARSKEGAFPPPEENYQFPSPTIGVSDVC